MRSFTTTNKDDHHTTSYFRLLWLSLILVSPALLYGLNLNLPTVALPLLNLNISTASWFGSIGVYSAPVGSIIFGVVIDKFGRKAALICGILPSLIGWSLLYWNYNETVLLWGQAINGLTIGFILYPIHVYAGECIWTQNVRLRNNFMVCVGFVSCLGTFLIICFSNFLNYSEICIVSLATVITILVIFSLVIPESPSWLYLQGRIGDAEWSEKKLGIAQPILHNTAIHSKVKIPPVAASEWSLSSISQSLEKLKRPDVYKPFYIFCIANVVMPLNGEVTVMMYVINIIDDSIPGQVREAATLNGTIVSPSEFIDPNQISMFCSLFTIVGCLASTFLLPLMGIKKLFITCNILTVLGLGILTYSTLDVAVSVLQLRVGAITLLSFLMGTIIGPWSTVSGDMFPVDCKGFVGVPITIGSLSAATGNKIFPYLYLNFGGYAYCFYAFFSILGVIFIYAVFPEVIGKTLEQINEEFLED